MTGGMADTSEPPARPDPPRVPLATADGRDLLLARLQAAVPEALAEGRVVL